MISYENHGWVYMIDATALFSRNTVLALSFLGPQASIRDSW